MCLDCFYIACLSVISCIYLCFLFLVCLLHTVLCEFQIINEELTVNEEKLHSVAAAVYADSPIAVNTWLNIANNIVISYWFRRGVN